MQSESDLSNLQTTRTQFFAKNYSIHDELHWFPISFDRTYLNIKTQYIIRDLSSKELIRDDEFEAKMNYDTLE